MSVFRFGETTIARARARMNIGLFLRQSQAIIQDRTLRGILPRVYLIGEAHTEHSHVSFAAEAIRQVKPNTIFSEGEMALKRPLKVPMNLRELIEECYANQHLTTLKELVSYVDTDLLDKAFFQIPYQQFTDLKRAIKILLIREGQDIVNTLDKQVNELYGSIADDKKIERVQDVVAWLRRPRRLHPALKEHFSSQEYGSLRGLILLFDEVAKRYSAFGTSGLLYVEGEDIDRKRSYPLVDAAAADIGATIKPWDDEAAKDAYIKGDPGANLRRETIMLQELLSELKTPGLILTYGGAEHIRDSSPILTSLQRRNVSFCAIRLKPEGNKFDVLMKAMHYERHLRGAYDLPGRQHNV